MGRTIALLLEYDGTGYHGFQYQENAVTVQGVLEAALKHITGETSRIRGAGRTDTGVHACGQVAAFTTEAAHEPRTFVSALNHYLPEDVTVRRACVAPERFDPRRQALRRRYRYLFASRASRPALDRRRKLWVRERLDTDRMAQAAEKFVGRHDFASFAGSLSGEGTSTVREVFRSSVERAGCEVSFEMEATAFLPQQVRRTAGVLLDIGRGRDGLERVHALMAQPAVGAVDTALPPHGLYLMEVTYPAGTLWSNQ